MRVIYRLLGRTGLRVSQLGFGAMRLPMIGHGKEAIVNRELAIPMIHRAFEAGVNYIDSAVFYCNADSERAVGEMDQVAAMSADNSAAIKRVGDVTSEVGKLAHELQGLIGRFRV